MIGLLILAQQDMGKGLLSAVEHVLGHTPAQLEAMPVNYEQAPEQIGQSLQKRIDELDQGDGVLILADIYGATHTNVACRFLKKNTVELITGVNLPMLIRTLNYRHLSLEKLVEKALIGGPEGIVCPGQNARKVEGGR